MRNHGTDRQKDSEIIRLEVSIPVHNGSVTADFKVPRRMRLAELAEQALALDDRLVENRVSQAIRQGEKISCQKGCAACCRQFIPVSAPEAWMLADRVAAIPVPRREPLLRRFAQARRGLLEEGLLSRYPMTTEAGARDLALAYFKLRIPCPFLEQESCSIYADRPSICREFLVTTPPALCSDPENNRGRPLRLRPGLTSVLAKIFSEVTGRAALMMPLASALEWAECYRIQGRRRYDSGELLALLAGHLRQD